MLYSKTDASKLLSCIIQKPSLFVETDNILLYPEDFENKVHKLTFIALFNLFHDGMEKIMPTDIINYIANFPEQNAHFKIENGQDYVMALPELGNLENLKYHYDTVKKHSLLRSLKGKFDVSHWHSDEIVDFVQAQETKKRFEESTVADIVRHIQGDLLNIERKYVNKKNFATQSASDEIDDLLAELKESPEFGKNLPGSIFNTFVMGARKSKVYICSAETGAGKTRAGVEAMAQLSYPIRWDTTKRQWVNYGGTWKTAIVTTELEVKEIQTLLLSYLSAVDEDKIINNLCDEEEWQRVAVATRIMKEYASNLIISHMPDPSIRQVETNMRAMTIAHKLDGLFFDYIHTSPNLMSDFGNKSVRDDLMLLMLSTSLKNFANELGVFVSTATQINEKGETMPFFDQGGIRGSRAIADKADVGYGMRLISEEVMKAIAPVIKTFGSEIPNLYCDFYKIRRGKYKGYRLFKYFDYSTMRSKDLFATRKNFTPIDIGIIASSDSADALTKSEIENITKQEIIEAKPIKQLKITL